MSIGIILFAPWIFLNNCTSFLHQGLSDVLFEHITIKFSELAIASSIIVLKSFVESSSLSRKTLNTCLSSIKLPSFDTVLKCFGILNFSIISCRISAIVKSGSTCL